MGGGEVGTLVEAGCEAWGEVGTLVWAGCDAWGEVGTSGSGGGEVCDEVGTSGVRRGGERGVDGRSGWGIGSGGREVERDDARGGGAEAAGLGHRAVFGGQAACVG